MCTGVTIYDGLNGWAQVSKYVQACLASGKIHACKLLIQVINNDSLI